MVAADRVQNNYDVHMGCIPVAICLSCFLQFCHSPCGPSKAATGNAHEAV